MAASTLNGVSKCQKLPLAGYLCKKSTQQSISLNKSEFLGSCISLSSSISVNHKNAARRSLLTMASGGSSAIPTMNDLPLIQFISGQGRISPPVEPNTEASVFAVFDANKKVQYVGFSKDVRNSLRTLIGRRPELCYYYKIYNLQKFDQDAMLEIRKQWFSELGLPPVGNTNPAQRAMWEKPSESGSISERGKVAAATSKAKTQLQTLQDRGLKEQMVYDPALLEQGLCDVLPSEEVSAEDRAAEDAEAALLREVSIKTPTGELVEFSILFEQKIKTNGGFMFDVRVLQEEKETTHRVVVGGIYYDAAKTTPEEFVEKVFAFLLHKRLPRRTEGVLTSRDFPVNYFAVSEVAQKFPELKDWFTEELPEAYWRFNRVHSYGNESSPVITETKLFSPKY